MKILVLVLPKMVTSTVWNTRAKTDVPQKTRPVRSHRTPGSRFSSASVHFTTPSSSPRAKKERKKERKRERKKERERETRILIYPLHILISLRVFFCPFSLGDFFPIFFWRLLHNKKRIDRVYPEQRRRRPSCVPRRAALRHSSGALGEVSASVDDASWCLIESIKAMSR